MELAESPTRPETVLIIDDDSRISELVAFHLEGVVEAFEFATSGEAGIRIATHLPPDIILLDIDMPGIDGFEVCRQLKAESATRDVPIIFLTGDSEANRKAEALDCGASDYVTKPFDAVDLQARVRSALRTKRLIDLLRFQARIDPLTGLGNRSVFDDSLEAALADFERNGGTFGLCMLDIDHFKRINDRFGHAAGDEVLRSVGRGIATCLRPYDVASRFGGEEFAVLLGKVEVEEAVETSERLLHTIRSLEIRATTGVIAVTASAGLALVTAADHPRAGARAVEAVLRSADAALYEAKMNGRDQLTVAMREQAGR